MKNSSIFREAQSLGRRLRFVFAVLGLLCVPTGTRANAPGIASPYLRKIFDNENGFPGGPVYAIAQTRDGYLWIGTEKGLVRFDGLNFRLLQHTNTSNDPFGPVLGLTTDAQGDLWIRLQGAGLLKYSNGNFERPILDKQEAVVSAMVRGANGDLLLSAIRNGMLRFRSGRFEQLAGMPKGSLPNFLVISMAEMDDGTIWLGTRDIGLFQLKQGQILSGPKVLRDKKINCLLSDKGDLWIGTDNGILRWVNGELTNSNPAPSLQHTQILAIARDRDGNIWVGSADGLSKIDLNGVVTRETPDHMAGGPVSAVFEDREGNLWAGNEQGLLQLRKGTFSTYAPDDRSPSGGPIYADSSGRIWTAGSESGLYRLEDGEFRAVKNVGLEKEVVYSIAGDSGGIWVGRQNGGLTHITYKDGSISAKTYTQASGLAQNSVYAVYEEQDGTVWAGTLSGGVSRFKNGHFSTYSTGDGLPSNTVSAIFQSSDGTMWFGTPKGVASLFDGKWSTFTGKDGLPGEEVNCFLEDSLDVLWVGTAGGLSTIRSGRVWTPGTIPELLRQPVLGMAQDSKGFLWISNPNHVFRIDREKFLTGTLTNNDIREYGIADGLRSREGVKRFRSVVADSSGRIWFSLNRSLSVVDPAHQPATSVPAVVQIEQVSSDDVPLGTNENVRIPAPHNRLKINYAGLSLAIPERVQFRYMLDGFDKKWSDPTMSREVTYANLDSGSYRFRLIASNSDGLWNSAESQVNLEIQPLLWQRWWFQLSGLAVIACGILLFIRLRMLRMWRQLNMRFEERLDERTRIARELHDTLLQGVISASMQLHVAVESLPKDSPARSTFTRILQLMTQVTEEGRNTVQGLRSSIETNQDLEGAFSRIPQELGHRERSEFRVVVQGHTTLLRTPIREEIYSIAREAIVNAFRHSHARNIEVQLEYGLEELRIIVGDDGCGIDPSVLHAGKEGHWGLSGMRERAKRIGATLKVLSRPAAGTEVQVAVPSQIAYAQSSSKGFSDWMKGLTGKGKKWSADL